MTEAWIVSFCLVLFRVAAFWMVLPIWSAMQIPRTVKTGMVVALSWFWFTGLSEPVSAGQVWAQGDIHWAYLVVVSLQEIALGVLTGMAVGVMLIPAQIAGSYIGQELGLSMATLADSANGAANNIVATLFQVFAVTLFFVSDLHHYLIYLLDFIFQNIPAGQPWDLTLSARLVDGFARITVQGLVICSPIVVLSMLLLTALLLLIRSAPNLNLFAVGIPVRLLAGLACIGLVLPALLAGIMQQFDIGIQFFKYVFR